MKGNFYAIQELIKEGKSEEAIRQLDNYIHTHPDCNDEPYYLLGNAYRKQGPCISLLCLFIHSVKSSLTNQFLIFYFNGFFPSCHPSSSLFMHIVKHICKKIFKTFQK